ncbi:hypothetical protein HPP92_003680 [Vanilla planifolia]|uniref:Glutamate receptor n=1 Tax=Vanilla planifolia TaxID=51239 RepID=A0A835S6P1_VANPL|nr:hypothetical protein HPP92_003680 [Vanilla planifolia]
MLQYGKRFCLAIRKQQFLMAFVVPSAYMLLMLSVLGLYGIVDGGRPAVVNIGAVLSYDSTIGRVAKVAIEAAVDAINANKDILKGTRLNLVAANSNCSAFIGMFAALKVLDKEVVTLIGPQSSVIAHMLSYFSAKFQVPLVSFADTDPSLSSLQYPYFVRMTQSDSYQMHAMADLIASYGWKQVIAVFIDDDYGRNGVYALDDELTKRKLRISYKIALPVGASRYKILELLQSSKAVGRRVYVVHASPDSGLDIFHAAQELQMMTNDFVWLATDWLSTILDTFELNKASQLNYLQGVVGFQQYIPQSAQKNAFESRWNKLHRNVVASSKLNTYAFYAYDTVWAVAYAINDFLASSGNITFSSNHQIGDTRGKVNIDKIKTFDGGHLLLQKLLLLNTTGSSGHIRFDSNRNLMSGAYKVINIYGSTMHTVGYWTNFTGLSASPSKTLRASDPRNLISNQVLTNITWPGGSTTIPRGWVPSTRERPLRIGVPRRVSYIQFVNISIDNTTFQGYCIDVFKEALKLLPYEVPYQFVPFGDGKATPKYWTLVNLVADNKIDALVGDISIAPNRTRIVDFTQPYISSGLVIVVPTKSTKSSAWVFLRPFTVGLWCVTGVFFFLIGIVIWILEHRVNKDFRGSPKRQCITIFLRRNFEHPWEICVDGLVLSSDGGDIKLYCKLDIISHYAHENSLLLGPKNGGVAAIVDELPYVEIFLATKTGFGIVGQPFTHNGWGFAFQRDSPLAVDISRAILQLSENGDLQQIHKKWFCQGTCTSHRASISEPNQLHLNSFWGLFLVCGIVTIAALLLFLLKAIRQFIRYNKNKRDEASMTSIAKTFYSFIDFIDAKEEAAKNMFRHQQCSSQPQAS